MEKIKTESRMLIDKAYDDGYKAGMLEFAPELEGLRIQNEQLSYELKMNKRKWWEIPLFTVCGMGAGLFAGVMINWGK